MAYIQIIKNWAYLVEEYFDDLGRRKRKYLRRASDEELAEHLKAKKAQKNLVPVSCTNPKCNNLLQIPREQKQKFFTTFPLRYGHFHLPYCSKECQEAHARELAPISSRQKNKPA